jgi:hypothetical protein
MIDVGSGGVDDNGTICCYRTSVVHHRFDRFEKHVLCRLTLRTPSRIISSTKETKKLNVRNRYN